MRAFAEAWQDTEIVQRLAAQLPWFHLCTLLDKLKVQSEREWYPLQKFDSDTERRFAIILERDATKWFKPAKGQFQIYYKLGTEQPEYIPDFVAETNTTNFLVETKARADINTHEVQAKAAAATRWCKHASDHASSVGSKPWKYLLVPHDEVSESKRLVDYLRFEIKAHEIMPRIHGHPVKQLLPARTPQG